MIKTWLKNWLFKDDLEKIYRIVKQKDNEIKNLKKRIEYLNFEITKQRLF